MNSLKVWKKTASALVFLLLVSCLLFTFPVLGQSPIVVWERNYGVLSEATCILQTTDGGFLIAGMSNSSYLTVPNDNVGSYCPVLLKVSPDGSVQWEKGYSSIDMDTPSSIWQVDSGFMIITNNGLVEIDNQGNIVWSKPLFHDGGYRGGIQTTDGDYILIGIDERVNPGSDFSIKLKNSGELVWNLSFAKNWVSAPTRAFKIIENNDGGFVIAGLKNTTAWVQRTDPYGSVLFDKTLALPYDVVNSFESIIKTSTGYLAVGSAYNGTGINAKYTTFLVKLDSNGNLVWFQDGYPSFPKALFQTDDFECFIVGGNQTKAWILNIDTFGNAIWAQTFGKSGTMLLNDVRSIFKTSDNTYVAFGNVNDNIWLIKMSIQPTLTPEPTITPNPTIAPTITITPEQTPTPSSTSYSTEPPQTTEFPALLIWLAVIIVAIFLSSLTYALIKTSKR
jgi:hypothetical protein